MLRLWQKGLPQVKIFLILNDCKNKISLFDEKFTLSFDGYSTITAQSSNYNHAYIILGNLRNTPFAVGSYSANKIVEAMFFDEWIVLADFPYAERYYDAYSTLTFQDELYYISSL